MPSYIAICPGGEQERGISDLSAFFLELQRCLFEGLVRTYVHVHTLVLVYLKVTRNQH
jgi:hypothetical protein